MFHKLNFQVQAPFRGGFLAVAGRLGGSFDEADRQHIRRGLPRIGKQQLRTVPDPAPEVGRSAGRGKCSRPPINPQRLITFVQDKLSDRGTEKSWQKL